MLDPRRLRTLADIAALGSIAAAAERAGVSPSAASQQISALERELGVDLLERLPRSVRLTPAGAELVRVSTTVLDGLDDALAAVRRIAGLEAGKVRLGTFASAVDAVVAPAAATFLRRYAGVDLHITEVEPEYAVPAVRASDLDIAITHRYSFAPDYATTGLVRRALMTEELLVVVPTTHRLAQRTSVAVRDTVDEAWIAPTPQEGFQAVIEHLARRGRFTPQVQHRCDNLEMMRSLVAAGLGIAVLPASAASARPGVQYLSLEGPAVTRIVDLVQRRGDPNPAVAALTKALAERAKVVSHR